MRQTDQERINRFPFGSSMISSAGYGYETQTLEVEFKDGDLYRYTGVPEEKWAAMRSAESAGRYFNANIKGKYPERKVG